MDQDEEEEILISRSEFIKSNKLKVKFIETEPRSLNEVFSIVRRTIGWRADKLMTSDVKADRVLANSDARNVQVF